MVCCYLQKGGVCFWGYTLRSFRVISHKYGRHSKNLHLYCDGRFAESSFEDKSVSRERGGKQNFNFRHFRIKIKTKSVRAEPVHGPLRYPGSPPSPPVRSVLDWTRRPDHGGSSPFSGQSGAGAELPRKKAAIIF